MHFVGKRLIFHRRAEPTGYKICIYNQFKMTTTTCYFILPPAVCLTNANHPANTSNQRQGLPRNKGREAKGKSFQPESHGNYSDYIDGFSILDAGSKTKKSVSDDTFIHAKETYCRHPLKNSQP
jgi:hypothetical protein